MTKLLGLQYRLLYKKGVDNRAANALSRKVSRSDDKLVAISTCVPAWLAELTTGYKADAYTSQLLTELSMGSTQHLKFQLKEGILRYDGRIWIGSNTSLQ